MEEISANPDILVSLGFDRLEQKTTDPVRQVWYRRFLYSIEALKFFIEIELEQYISDDLSVDNFNDYSFNRIYMIITEDDLSNEEQGRTGLEGIRNIRVHTFEQLSRFLAYSESLEIYFDS